MANISTDFVQIKKDLKTFLAAQDELQDFDFEGSGLNVLLDSLAYATTYQSLTANLAISEAFINTAQIRRNIVARVKEINYFPRQIASAVASLDLTITPTIDPNAPIVVPRGTRFSSNVDGESFTFVTTDDLTLLDTVTAGTYTANININQGVFRSQKFTRSSDVAQRFILAQSDIDPIESFFTVTVRTTALSGTIVGYTRTSSVVGVDGDSTVYYIQESDNGNVEIYFGDGVLGKELVTNNSITVTYLATKGKLANSASVFSLVDNISSYSKSLFTISNVIAASGGADEETIEEIKFNAPLVNTTQERAITVNDYRALILNKFPAIESLNVWGGEDNIPPQYGKVFIALKPNYGLTISPATKAEIKSSILDRYSAIGITPDIVDAEYTYINVTSLVTYNDDKTSLKIGEMNTKITDGIVAYFSNSISSFNTDFRFSKLTSYIDGIDISIVGNSTTITIAKKFTPVTGVKTTANLQFNASLIPGSIQSNVWTDVGGDTWEVRDDSTGKVYFYKNDVINGESIGQVDYIGGVIDIQGAIFYTQTNAQEITIYANPVSNDITMNSKNIMLLNDNDITVEKLA